VANLGENLWKNFDSGKVASIRAARIQYVARCQSRLGGKRTAVIQIGCRDTHRAPVPDRDLCEAQAKPLNEYVRGFPPCGVIGVDRRRPREIGTGGA